jgi:Arc/MetJ-type ribon-helix-helix transcriptional regulator
MATKAIELGDAKTVCLSVKVPEPVNTKLEEMALSESEPGNRANKSDMVRRAVMDFIEQHDAREEER